MRAAQVDELTPPSAFRKCLSLLAPGLLRPPVSFVCMTELTVRLDGGRFRLGDKRSPALSYVPKPRGPNVGKSTIYLAWPKGVPDTRTELQGCRSLIPF